MRGINCTEAPTYLDPARVKAVKETCVPCSGTTRTGYGPKLATPWLLRIDGKRWHRVYIMQWSNAGTAYIIIRGERHLLGTYDPRQALVLQGQPELAADYMRHLAAR